MLKTTALNQFICYIKKWKQRNHSDVKAILRNLSDFA